MINMYFKSLTNRIVLCVLKIVICRWFTGCEFKCFSNLLLAYANCAYFCFLLINVFYNDYKVLECYFKNYGWYKWHCFIVSMS